MFAKPRPKKSLLPPPPKKRKVFAIEEISFDNSAREEYLTGFHKRKVQRQKHAQEEAAKTARAEKIEMRKQIRDERRQEVEAHVKNIEALLKENKVAGLDSDDEDGSGSGGDEEWDGIEDGEAAAAEPTPEPQPVDHEEEYIDEDLYTTVKIEAVSVDRDGLHNKAELEKSGETDEAAEKRRKAEAEAAKAKPKRDHPTNKKKKFKYESKFDRQKTNRKNNKRKGPPA